MNYCPIKFKFDLINDNSIKDIFDNVKYLLNYQFDDDSNVFFIDADVDYQIEDVSDLNSEDIERIANSFFNFEFEDTINVFLYKFLVLKNKDKFSILANIHPLILNYSSINDLYELFSNVNVGHDENHLINYYRDVNDYLNCPDYDNDSDYWRNIGLTASDYIKFHNLKSDNYKRQKIEIDRKSVLDFINSHDCSLFNFYACAFSLYISRINRQGGCLLKTNIASKGAGLKTILKFDLNSTDSFADYLHQFTTIYDESVSHTKVSIENYIDEDLTYYSIYDFSGLNENICIYNGDDSALTLNIYNDCLEIVYNADLFSDIYIQHMADNIRSMIDNVVEFPDNLFKDVNILSDNEKKLISEFCRGKDVDVDDDFLISRFFRRHALENPDAIAIDDGVNQVSYGELEKSSNSIANDLSENYGISLDSHVALILPRNYHYPELALALNKLGAAFIPIDTIYPLKRIEHMLEISEAQCIVTTKDIAGKFDFDLDIICIEDLNYDDDVEVEIVATSKNLFSIMFTSGTTGLPKGVKVLNHQLAGLYESFKNIFYFSYGDIIGCYLSFSFIASYVIFVAFAFGGGCRIFNESEQKDILSLIRILNEKPMNSLCLPPTLAVPILESGDIKLDYLVLGGGKLKELSKKNTHTQLINIYGTTEIGFGIFKSYDIKDIDNENLPIGRPVTNTNAYILDEHANQMPIGVPGEICISSEYISPGYYNNPELTSEVFVDNPYSDGENNKIMYRTGDIGFYNFDGDIEILGREDDQLSVRGFRIESGEILNIVNSIPEIENVYLDVENDTLALYYTTNAEIDIGLIKEKLMGELPGYMVPSLFMELEEIPLNMNGKIDKTRLKKMSKVNSEMDIEDEVLKGVVDAFREVLETDLVLVDDDFVELGGNSLSAMKLQILLKEKFAANLSSNEIIELSTPANIADTIKFYSDRLKEMTVNYAFDGLCPLSESQLNVYLDESVNSMGTAYNNPFKIDFRNNYSAEEIKNALIKLLDVFPVLKARVLNDEKVSFAFDGEPEIAEGTLNDIGSFVRPFEFDRYLSRFLLVDDNASVILCADFHHLIFDGTSLGILLNRLLLILNEENGDFIDNGVLRQISFEEMLDTGYIDDAKEFFDKMLADRDEVYDLLPSVDGGDETEFVDTFDIDEEYLTSFLQDHSITYNQFFASVFGYALSRFSGSNKVLFNMIEDGRGHIDLSESVGMFVKTLPVLMDCENQNVDSFLLYSSSLINSIMKYDLYPFRVLANEYDLNSDILFQYSHNLFSDMLNKDDLKYDVDELEHDLNADLSFYIFNDGKDKFIIRILYSSLYSKSFIEHFVESYKLILHDMIEVNELKDINYMSDADLKLLDSYNQTEHSLIYDDILDAFNDNLLKYPQNELVSYYDVSYSYAEGAYIADAISRKLIDLGVEAQDCISFLVPRSELYMFCVLAIMSAGAVYVPLDENLPDERIRFMIKDTESRVVIVSDETYERGCDLAQDSTVLNISDIVNGEIKSLNKLDVSYGNLACILYTSGSTGLPKGVKITRKSIVNFIDFHVNDLEILRSDVYGLFASIGFDVAMAAIFSAIYCGACLNVIPDDIKLNIKLLNEHILKYGITHSYITTQIAKLFVSEIEETSLKVLVAGGEKLGQIDEIRDYRIVDAYGPTEACVYVISADTTDKIDYSSVGHVQINTKAYILDKEFRKVPVGAVGELYLSGCQLADGYLNRPEETGNAFSANPFEDNDEYSRLYCTGDVARLLPDGTYGIVGRRDSQIKVRGNRIELSEVETSIREMDIIDDVTVQVTSINENNELIAYVVSDDSDEEHLKDLVCDYVAKRKPDYMIPSFVMKLETIPLNINGKVDKRALPEVDIGSLTVDYVAPTNETEEQIVDAFEVVFNQKGIGLNDDFTRMGGDSITAIRLVSLLEKDGIFCSARDILNYKTPYLIAQNAEKISKKSYDATIGEVDLLPMQSYFFNQVNSNEFTQEFVLKSKDNLDLDTLQRAFDELANVHDMLRATYRHDNNKVIQEILPLNSSVCKIKEYTVEDLNNAVKDVIDESKKSLDIGSNLIKISLIHHDDGSYVVFVIHHLIVDGVSWSILIDDLTYIINQIKNNGEINLLRPYPYKNWVGDVKSLAENIPDDEKQHWIEVNGLLNDSAIRGNSKGFVFNSDVLFDMDNLLMLSEEEYWALCIARAYKKTYDEDIIFNRETYGRDESLADVNRTFGWFTSQYPALADVNGNYDDISLINDVYSIKNAFKDVNHLGLNYGSLIYDLHELEYRHCPVTFNFLSTEFSFENELFESVMPQMSFDSDDLEISDLDYDSFGISLNVSRIDDCYVVNGDYADDTYLGDKFEEFIDNIRYELKYIGDYESDRIICCLSESQLGIYLDEKVNDMGTAYSVLDILECGNNKSVDEIKAAIGALIDKHPILKGRVVDGEVPLLVCDSYPSIEHAESDDYRELVKPFDLNDSLARFYILEKDNSRFIFYDIHHIINDATSRAVIINDLALALDGALNDSVDLGFVYGSRDSFNSQFESIYTESYEFYRNNLSDIDETSALLEDIEGVDNSIRLPIHDVREDVETFCRESGITVGNFLNAVFAYTYSRFTGSNKVYYNFTENGRREDYTQNAAGMFVRTIPIIVSCENTSVSEYLSGVSDLILDCMKYSVYPFRLLAHEFDLNNDVFFEYNFDLNDVSGVSDELIIEDRDIGLVSDFLCVVNNLDDGYIVSAESSGKHSNDTIIRFLNAFDEILRGLLDCDMLSDIDYVSADDLVLLDEINDTEHDLLYDDILDAFNYNLTQYPDSPLVSMDNTSYSYAEGAFIADKIAESLKDLGAGAEDNVAFLLNRSELYMLAILGIVSMGAVYVPLDDAHPDDRIKFILNDTESKVVIVSDETYERADNLADDAAILNISEILKGDIQKLSSLPVISSPLICILYTSGTTGIPKGVKITRKSVVNYIGYYVRKSGISHKDVFALYASIGFDVGAIKSIFVPMYCGACLDIIPNDIRLDMNRLNSHFNDRHVTHAHLPTQVAKLFINEADNQSLDVLCTGGEKLGEITYSGNYLFIDSYGPTEACVSVTAIKEADKLDSSSVGYLLDNLKAYVLDDEFRRVPVGAVGELYLSGIQIADGYLNRDEETVKAFLDNPFDSQEEFAVMYRTGDMVRVLPDKSLAIVGRQDGQVKVRGNRLELTEVENVIREIRYVDDVTVQIIKHDTNNELVAYVVVSNDLDGNELKDSICDYVNRYKPDYMVPSFVMRLDEIPLNVNGKVDKRALPDVDRGSLHAEYVAPRDENEKEIVEAFEKALDLENVSIYDDFVRLGGDSLNAVRLLNYIESDDVTMADIFTFRTPEAIAKNMSEFSFDLDIYSLEDGCPLNSAQINVLADVTVYNKDNAYHVLGYIPISKDYGLEKILDSLDELLDMHPILSTHLTERYEESDKDISNWDLLKDLMTTAKKFGMKKIMNVAKQYGISDLKGLYKMLKTIIKLFKEEYPYLVKGDKPQISVKSEFDKNILIDFFDESFDLYNYLSKFMVVESENSYYLFYMIHHIIFDATSAVVFKRDLQTLLDGGSIDFDDTFLKASAFTHQIKNTEKFDEAAEFYHSFLSDLDDVGSLPEDNPSAEGYNMSAYDLEFDKTAFKSFLRNAGISENVLFTSVFSYTLSKFTKSNKVLFVTTENGRDRFNEDFICMTSNVNPVVIDCKDQSIGSYIEDVADTVFGVIRHSYYPMLLLYQKYDFESNIIFQYVPDWVAEDFTKDMVEIENIKPEEIYNYLLNQFSDSITEFFFEVYQSGDDYALIITHSNRYSDKMVEDFKNMYISVLYNIINSDVSSNLSNLLR
ncbi:D-alanine--poly(phosphoribitol) ligase subunit DltA [Methanobrevibacter sp.]|uniref:D-alanine--poly(phosphoribitol) ligase subunit DltA n=1 Tax=Methanobrevibacter sp. TaxID=66852 RepID=UPI00386CD3B5